MFTFRNPVVNTYLEAQLKSHAVFIYLVNTWREFAVDTWRIIIVNIYLEIAKGKIILNL